MTVRNIKSPKTPPDAGIEDADQRCHRCGDDGPYHYIYPYCPECAAFLEAINDDPKTVSPGG